MFRNIDKQWREKGTAVACVSTGDLGRSMEQLDYLSGLANLKGILMMPHHKVKPIYFPVCRSQKNYKHTLIQAILFLASAGGMFPRVQAIQNEDALPDDTQVISLQDCVTNASALHHGHDLTR